MEKAFEKSFKKIGTPHIHPYPTLTFSIIHIIIILFECCVYVLSYICCKFAMVMGKNEKILVYLFIYI